MRFFLNKLVSLCDIHWGNFNKFSKFVKFIKMARVQRVNDGTQWVDVEIEGHQVESCTAVRL
jgi:hypothetical protein